MHHPARGITLVEVLVVLIIIVVLLSILLPGVKQSGGDARRQQCRYNLREIGLALHNYHDTHGAFPPGAESPHELMPNWRLRIFPQLNQGDLYNSLDLTSPTRSLQGDCKNPNMMSLSGHTIQAYVCPSSVLNPTADLGNNPYRIQTPMYIGIAGVYPDPLGRTVGSHSSYGGQFTNNGVLLHNEVTHISDIADGTSNTLMVAEQSGRVDGQDLRSGYSGGYGGCHFLRLQDATPTIEPVSETYPNGAESWTVGLTSIQYPINTQTTAPGSDQNFDANTIINSEHKNGIHVLLADGSARFISNNIDSKVVGKLASRNDGLDVGEY